jgi:chromosome segregation ATPase
LVFGACASQPKQETITQLAKTESSIQQAEQMGALEGALPELQQARDKLAEAQGALQRKQEGSAIRLAQQAQVDAQYAASKAQAAREQRAASEVKQGVNTVRETATDTSSTTPR